MSEPEPTPPRSRTRTVLMGGALLALALGGAVVARLVAPSGPKAPRQGSAAQAPRPLVQIVRTQPGLPDLADLVDRTCPSIAVIVSHSDQNAVPAQGVPAFAYSPDGWLVANQAALPEAPLDALFSDGTRVAISDVRTDDVTGLAALKSAATPAALDFTDQPFPRVGQFGIALAAGAGQGCSAGMIMVGSDFLADGGSPIAYARLQSAPDFWTAGTPLIGSDGRVQAVGLGDPPGAVIPAAFAQVVIDELVRGRSSPSVAYGFRTMDFAGPIANRVGDVRTGAAVAYVEKGSPADKAGLRAGDLITTVDEQPVSGASELGRLLDGAKSQVALGGRRRGDSFQISVRAASN